MRLTSPAFLEGMPIPKKYGRDFQNISPPLEIEDVPSETVSLVLIVTDPDIPEAGKKKFNIVEWDHWTVFNIPPTARHILEGKNPDGIVGKNTNGENAYGGPRPPDREHRYFFTIYALDTTLDLKTGATKNEVLEAMRTHILGQTTLVGTFKPTQ